MWLSLDGIACVQTSYFTLHVLLLESVPVISSYNDQNQGNNVATALVAELCTYV